MKFRNLLLGALAAAALVPASDASAANVKRIYNGNTWYDTAGKAINAHGGGMYYENGYYYWFGENRSGMASYGVSVYRSEDLLNWEPLGLALTPSGDRKNTLQDVAEGRTIERPKVIFNEKTGKYVMWAHWEDGNDYSKARVMIAQADRPEGPYELVRTIRPNGAESRDQTVFVDDDGTGYHFSSSEDNMTMHLAVISDDYLTPTENWMRIFAGKQYEAPAIMKINSTYIGFFSGCTGWRPNPGHVATTRKLMGEWADLGNPCVDANAETTYTSQPTYALKVAGYDYAYMYMGDRWNSSNVQTSTYVWLPVMLRTGVPFLRWFDNWDPKMFELLDAIRRAESVEAGNTYVLLSRLADRPVSLNSNKVCLYDDSDEKILNFTLEATDEPDTYVLRRADSDDCLVASGSSVALQANATGDEAKWTLERQADGFYLVISKSARKVLSVVDASMSNGASLELIARTTSAKAKFGLYFDSRKYDYVENSPWGEKYVSGIEDVAATAVPCELEYDAATRTVHSSAVLDAADCMLVDLAGRALGCTVVRAAEGTDIVLPDCPAGIYVLRAGEASLKLALR